MIVMTRTFSNKNYTLISSYQKPAKAVLRMKTKLFEGFLTYIKVRVWKMFHFLSFPTSPTFKEILCFYLKQRILRNICLKGTIHILHTFISNIQQPNYLRVKGFHMDNLVIKHSDQSNFINFEQHSRAKRNIQVMKL